MAFYQVLLNGSNFCFNVDGKIVQGGFVTTRWVKAESAEIAESIAVDLIKGDASLQEIVVKAENVTPVIHLEEISIVSWLTYLRKKPGKGYSLYDEQDS